jgi:hypothetical protein
MGERKEWRKCSRSCAYFLNEYGWIYNATVRDWIRFDLWPAQVEMLGRLLAARQCLVLKARQLGLTWLVLGYALWLLIYRPAATVLLFSLRDGEAVELLKRLKGMYGRLPVWSRCRGVTFDSAHEWVLSNGSVARAFPTTGGRSYTASLVVVDEADFIPNLGDFLNAVKPTVDAGGQLVMISTVDKGEPLSTFKSLVRDGLVGRNEYETVFLPWSARPDRTAEWYERIAADMRSQAGGSDDDLFQEYPGSVDEALAPRQQDKRFPFAWISAVSVDIEPVTDGVPALAGLRVYVAPEPGRSYVVGADCAEGNPNSDDSVACVLESETWGQVAVLAGKFEPGTFAGALDQLAAWYNQASVMVERNNHGHATLLALDESGKSHVMAGYDKRPGWFSNAKGKTLMYDLAAEVLRDGTTAVPDRETRQQLATIEANTLRAPNGLLDDHADAYCLALAGLKFGWVSGEESTAVAPVDALAVMDKGGW